MSGACNSALNTDLVTAESGRTSAKQSSIGLAPDTWTSSDFGTEYSAFDTIEGVAANGNGEFILITGSASSFVYAPSTGNGSVWEYPYTLSTFTRSPSAIGYLNGYCLITAGNQMTWGDYYDPSVPLLGKTGTIGFGSKASVFDPVNSYYIAGGQNGQVSYSTNLDYGVVPTWTIIPNTITTFTGTGSAYYINAAAYGSDNVGNDVFVFGGGSGHIAYTDDIKSATPWNVSENSVSIFGSTGFVNVIVYGEPNGVPTFVGVGETARGTGVAAYSTDGGNTWSTASIFPIGINSGVYALAYGRSIENDTPYFVAGDDDGNIAYSLDGEVWIEPQTTSNPVLSGSVNGIAYGTYYDDTARVTKGRFVAVGGGTIVQSYYADIN